jgi:hypothetical protein
VADRNLDLFILIIRKLKNKNKYLQLKPPLRGVPIAIGIEGLNLRVSLSK